MLLSLLVIILGIRFKRAMGSEDEMVDTESKSFNTADCHFCLHTTVWASTPCRP